jgi:hypothetical protein
LYKKKREQTIAIHSDITRAYKAYDQLLRSSVISNTCLECAVPCMHTPGLLPDIRIMTCTELKYIASV